MNISVLKNNTGIVQNYTIPVTIGIPDRTRTYYLEFRKLSLYPGELRGHTYIYIISKIFIYSTPFLIIFQITSPI